LDGGEPKSSMRSEGLKKIGEGLISSIVDLLSFYPIIDGYSYAYIYVDSDGSKRYEVVEPHLNERERSLLLRTKEALFEYRGVIEKLIHADSVEEGIRVLKEVLTTGVKNVKLYDAALIDKISYYLSRDLIGYSILDPLIRDPNLEDIVCSGVNTPIHVFHSEYEWLKSNVVFTSDEELESMIRKLAFKAGVEVNVSRPIAEGILKEGFRVHLALNVVSRRGSTFTIRKFKQEPYTLVDLINLGTLDPLLAAYLWLLSEKLQSILIVGPTASGKTTLLNAIALMIPPEVKVVTVEEAPELNLVGHENWVSLVARLSSEEGVSNITLYELLKSALRQRPDVIIVGEIRGEEAYTFFQSIALGHGGLSTIHGDSVESVIRRLEAHPFNVPRSLIQMVRVLLYIGRVQVGEYALRRRVLEVKEIHGLDPKTNELILATPFRWIRESDSFAFSGYSHALKFIADRLSISYDEVFNDLLRRAVIMRWLSRKKVGIRELHSIVRRYGSDWFTLYSLAASEVGPIEFP